MSGEEARTELSCGLRASAIDQLIQNVVLNMIMLAVIVQLGFFLGYLYACGIIDFDFSPRLLRGLMRELLDVKNGEWFPRMSEIDNMIIDLELNLNLLLCASATIFRILQEFPDPSLSRSLLVLMIELVEAVNNLVGKLVVE